MARPLPDYKTYAISLFLDEDFCKKISSVQNQLADLTGNDYLIKNSVPPHITLGMFHASDEEFNELKQIFSDFALEISGNFSLSFDKWDNFKEKVIFLNLEKDSALIIKNLNFLLHQKISKRFRPGGNQNYLPEKFFPHVALSVKMSPRDFEKAANYSPDLPSSGKVTSLSLFQCHPYMEMASFSFLF